MYRDASLSITTILLLLGALNGSGCKALGYLTVSESKSLFTIAKSPENVVWDDAKQVASDLGIVVQPQFFTNSGVSSTDAARSNSEAPQFSWNVCYGSPMRTASVAFPPGPWKTATTRILSREVRNVFGSTVLAWTFDADVTFSDDHQSYLVEVDGTGGGPEGYSVLLAWSYSHANRLMDMVVVEQLPGHSAKRKRIRFRVTDTCELVPVQNDVEVEPRVALQIGRRETSGLRPVR